MWSESGYSHGVDICVIEDDINQSNLLVERLLGMGYSVIHAENGREGIELVYRQRPRVVICDVLLPELSGIDICRQVRNDASLDGVYFVVMTAYDSPERKRSALNAGADDYLCKPYDIEELKARIRSGMRYHRLQARLHRAAVTDSLTNLWNYNQFRQLLDREFARTRRYGGVVSLIMMDLDHFKVVNDSYGHETGNEVLKAAARHMLSVVRDTDVVARYGGEEFAIICPETHVDQALMLADRLRVTMAQQVRFPAHPQLVVRASFGVVSSADARVGSVNDLINLGDQALYCSKRTGRDRVTRADAMSETAAEPDCHLDEVDRLRKEVHALSVRGKELCLRSVWALIQALEARDGYSAWHSRNVTFYTKWLAEAAGWPRPMRNAIANAAMLHDLGKIGVPDEMLFKPQPLTADEAAILRQVPQLTCRILEPLRLFETEIEVIRHLRERFDGMGYPDGLHGESIPIGSRMLAITEAFDSITCNRAYRQGRSLEEALDVMAEESGKQFDPKFVDLLTTTVHAQRKRWQNRIDQARVEASCEVNGAAAAAGAV